MFKTNSFYFDFGLLFVIPLEVLLKKYENSVSSFGLPIVVVARGSKRLVFSNFLNLNQGITFCARNRT